MGSVVASGAVQGVVDFGGGPLAGAGAHDVFVAKFNASGNHLWSRRFGDASYDYGNDVAVDASRNVVVTGSFQGTVDFGGGLLTSAGASDIFVTKFDADGAHVWARRFGDGDDQFRSSVAADDSRDIVVAGSFQGAVDFGGGLLTSAGVDDIFVAKLDSDGGHLWSRRFGDVSYDYGIDVAVEASRNVVVTGSFRGAVDFGGGPLTSAGDSDIFIMKLAPDGAHVWARHFGDSGYQRGNSVLADGAGNVVLTGAFASTVNFGGETLTSVRSYDDIFVAKFVEQAPLSALITRFEATAVESAARVTWEVWTDEAIESYTLYRRDDPRPQAIVIAQGPFDPTTRSYIDASVEPGRTYHYELLIHTRGGDDIRSLVATLTIPEFEAVLGQNFPNPFEPSTTIEYTLSKRSSAVLGIYDAAGRLIVRLDQGVRDAGRHRDEWNGRDADGRRVGSGVYFYRLEGAPSVAARKMVLMR